MIGSVRRCITNGDFYIVVKRKDSNNFMCYWSKIGLSCDDIDDIMNDEEVHSIPENLVRKIDIRYFLNLCKKAYEVKYEASSD
ncbi:MAG: hypothetical protein NC124_02165 [Clostridium sp.]|nr:hypothetical protein [Clostridium sp.]